MVEDTSIPSELEPDIWNYRPQPHINSQLHKSSTRSGSRKRSSRTLLRYLLLVVLGLAFLSTACGTPLKSKVVAQHADPDVHFNRSNAYSEDIVLETEQDHFTSEEPSSLSSTLQYLSSTSLTSMFVDYRDFKNRKKEMYNSFWSELRASFDSPEDHGKRTLSKRGMSTANKVEAAMIAPLVILSGVFAGLTLGYFSVDPTQLQVLSISGTPTQQKYARKIMPVRKNGHLLLTSLVIVNMLVNEALPVVADEPLGGGVQAVIVSTVLIVIFAEIIPQSVCARHGLWVGAKMAPFVRILMYAVFIIAYPVSKLLEYVLGAHHGIIYRRSELRELIKIHQAGVGGGDLDQDTVTMTQGALGLQDKVVKDVMTGIEEVFMLPLDAKLDYETLGQVVRSGHSRIPVYTMVEVPDIASGKAGQTRTDKRILGNLLVKSCVLLDPEDATPLATMPLNTMPSVPWDEPLTQILNVFQEGRSHMAIVSKRGKRLPQEAGDTESVMSSAAVGMRKRILRKIKEKVAGSDSGSSDEEAGSTESRTEKGKAKRSGGKVASAVPGANKIAQAVQLNQQEMVLPSDAQLEPESMEKFLEGLEGTPLGIVTLEDILEALIGEEIYDEFDPPEETGHNKSAASVFVPKEALEAEQAAAMRRLQLSQAATIVFGGSVEPTNSVGPDMPSSNPTKKLSTRLGVPAAMKFAARRTQSVPGKRRSTGGEDKTVAEVKPVAEVKRVHDIDTPLRTESPEPLPQLELGPIISGETAFLDEKGISAHAAQLGPSKRAVAFAEKDPLSAVPARLLDAVPPPKSSSPVSSAAALPSDLSAAVLHERGRRRGAGGSITPPISIVSPGGAVASIGCEIPRAQSASGVSRTSNHPGIVAPVPRKGVFKSAPGVVSPTPVTFTPEPN